LNPEIRARNVDAGVAALKAANSVSARTTMLARPDFNSWAAEVPLGSSFVFVPVRKTRLGSA